MELIKVLSNPIKLQIMQYLQMKQTATTKQIAEKLSDIPTATLYRHINSMIKENILVIKEERKVRGSVERLIAINTDTMIDVENEEIASAAYQFFMNLYLQFQNYSTKENIDPRKDLLSMRTCLLSLTDEKFYNLIVEWRSLLDKYRSEEDKVNGKMRSVSFISAPVEQGETKDV